MFVLIALAIAFSEQLSSRNDLNKKSTNVGADVDDLCDEQNQTMTCALQLPLQRADGRANSDELPIGVLGN
uniref:Secreted protein n=1 Tax=Ascaris lumbricoides TaxID=6252 RepID=A0A0M3HP74_ASCLU